MNDCGIYRLDFPNGDFYIGSSKRLVSRIRQHRSDLKGGSHSNSRMQRVFNKHGAFTETVLHRIAEWTRLQWEQSYLDEFFGNECCLNLSPQATGGSGKPSEETRAKMSATRRGKKKTPMSDDAKANIGAASKGRRHSEETKAKMSAANKGVPKSEEHKAKIRESLAARHASVEVIP